MSSRLRSASMSAAITASAPRSVSDRPRCVAKAVMPTPVMATGLMPSLSWRGADQTADHRRKDKRAVGIFADGRDADFHAVALAYRLQSLDRRAPDEAQVLREIDVGNRIRPLHAGRGVAHDGIGV